MSATPLMDSREIKKWLPHRYPFLLIDRVLELREGEYIRARKNITINEEVFNGHFPQGPVFPGVMIIEAMAQASGILGFKTINKTPDDGFVYLFASAEKVRFRRQVVPGDCMELEATVVSKKRSIWKFDCQASVDNALAASATICCAHRKI